ncbi:major facilitator superfamily domain-containing protein [Triangularia setosa]|uniref:Major facilitator superfamily domain-containing protein n=1 Tax=Triangularia setosa TaxID=2587417 RepID=A0AAN7A3T2_9PEZI|nr:major facilitator superfamily domain-containing protein [Podospora setosa]
MGDVDRDADGDTNVVNRAVRRAIDLTILPLLVWVYFLQILDKTVLGFSAIFGLPDDLHLHGNQYSLVGTISPIAQLAIQPISSWLIVRVPHRVLMPGLVLGWGLAQTATPFCKDFAQIMTARFFLGVFEGGCLPLFSVITGHWYTRGEQPLRVAAWYGTNGLGTVFAALLSFGLGRLGEGHGQRQEGLKGWQWIFLSTGILTVITVPFVYLRLDNNIQSARFLTEREKIVALERARGNQTGSSSTKENWKWKQIREVFLDIKTWLFLGMTLGNNIGAQVTVTFGPFILSGLGYDKYTTTLLNIPFGAMQYLIILITAWGAVRLRLKAPTLCGMIMVILAGLIALYTLPRGHNQTGRLLAGFYCLAFIFGCNTLIVSWILANTAGQTKRAAIMSLYNAASSTGNIIGPLLFHPEDAPAYMPGLRATMGVFAAMLVIVLIQVGILVGFNKRQERIRVERGKPARVGDLSMGGGGNEFRVRAAERTFEDLTDLENDEFVYLY